MEGDTANSFSLFVFELFGSHPRMLRTHSWLCSPESLLVVLQGPYERLGIDPGLITYECLDHKTMALIPKLIPSQDAASDSGNSLPGFMSSALT